MAKFVINASGAMLLPSLVQVTESISGSVVPLAMFSSVIDGEGCVSVEENEEGQLLPVQKQSTS